MVVVDGDGGGQDSLAVGGDSVEAWLGDFGDQSVAAEFGDESGDSGASSVCFLRSWGRVGVEAGDEVGVAEPDDGVLAGEDGPE